MKHVVRDAVLSVIVFLFATSVVWAQATAQMSGTVRDESGAVLPGVTVTVTQTDTGFTRTVVTEGEGSYVMSNLQLGPYRLEISLQGFRTYVQTGIVLQVGGSPTINAVLEVGNLEESVTVDAAAPLVDVQSAGIGEVIQQEQVLELPLQGRNVMDLILLSGAAVEAPVPSVARALRSARIISVAGGLGQGVAYKLDGAIHNDPQNASSLPLPFPDALQEFRVGTGGLSAESGMHSGASVSAVTKSGTNRFAGNVFDFLRDKRFNATNPFAATGPDGKRADDGLKRQQFGGTLGGPIVKNRLFFFGGYQDTIVRTTPKANIEYVPTPAMLAGDYTAVASAACNGGREITLRAPFVNNRIDPALFSDAAVNIAARLPRTTDPCGMVNFGVNADSDAYQAVSRIDFQLTNNNAIFGRYLRDRYDNPPPYTKSDNILTSFWGGYNTDVQTLALGNTQVFGTNLVNALRFAYNRVRMSRNNAPTFSAKDIGANVYSYVPNQMVIAVAGAFNINDAGATLQNIYTDTWQIGDEFTIVKGNHQMGMGGDIAYWKLGQFSSSRSGGVWNFNNHVTGLSLADFMLGRLNFVEHGGLNELAVNQKYIGLYVQDAWRASGRVTVNMGLRWEPFFGQEVTNGAVYNFVLDNFNNNVKSTAYRNAPAGLIYPGDPGFPPGRTGLNKQWWNFSPRGGLGWDVLGDGRVAVRASYSLGYDFPTAEYHNINGNAPPFGNRARIQDPASLMDDPYRDLGGDPHPITIGPDAAFVPFGAFGAVDPNVDSPRVQSWNATVERQFGTAWQGAVSYIGRYSDRLWGMVQINPGVFRGLGPCTIAGRLWDPCTQTGNLNQRRVLYEQNTAQAQFIGPVDVHTNSGTQSYRGLKLSVERRAATGLSLNANYTWSRCFGNLDGTSYGQISAGFTDPANPAFDRGYCNEDRSHNAIVTVGAQTPQFASTALRALASEWRASGIFSVRSGGRLNVMTSNDVAATGIAAQRVNQVSDDVYRDSLTNYLNQAAFAEPAPGTLGNVTRNEFVGPGFWTADLALSKRVRVTTTQTLELRIETFNLFNTFNWGNPVTDISSGSFGRITSMTGEPRIMQFGIKYGF